MQRLGRHDRARRLVIPALGPERNTSATRRAWTTPSTSRNVGERSATLAPRRLVVTPGMKGAGRGSGICGAGGDAACVGSAVGRFAAGSGDGPAAGWSEDRLQSFVG